MKKILTLLFLVAMMTTCVLAQKPEVTGNGNGWLEVHPSVNGLEQATFMVQNEAQVSNIEQVMNKIQERDRERINQFNELIIEADNEGEITIEGIGTGKFLGLVNLRYRYQYDMNEETGELIRVHKAWDFLFTELDE